MVSSESSGDAPSVLLRDRQADERILAFLNDAIASGKYASGARLPTERGLAASLDIPRTAVRRGLAVLEAQGRITRHVGRGTFVVGAANVGAVNVEDVHVGDANADRSIPIGRATSPAEIMDVRLMLEPQIAALAADCATSPELERIGKYLVAAEAARTTEEFEKWDGALHHAIAAATHNAFLLRIFDVVHAVRDEPLWGSLKRRSFTAARRRDYQRDHRRIVDALGQRDGEAARRFMREHILRVRGNLLNRE